MGVFVPRNRPDTRAFALTIITGTTANSQVLIAIENLA